MCGLLTRMDARRRTTSPRGPQRRTTRRRMWCTWKPKMKGGANFLLLDSRCGLVATFRPKVPSAKHTPNTDCTPVCNGGSGGMLRDVDVPRAMDDLRGGPPDRDGVADLPPHGIVVFAGPELARHAEISHKARTAFVDEDVARCQIAVDEPGLFQICHPRSDIRRNVEDSIGRDVRGVPVQ